MFIVAPFNKVRYTYFMCKLLILSLLALLARKQLKNAKHLLWLFYCSEVKNIKYKKAINTVKSFLFVWHLFC